MKTLSPDQLDRLKLAALNSDAVFNRMDLIKQQVATVYGVDPALLFGKRRFERIIWPRHLSIWLCRHFSSASQAEIALHYGLDHTTVLNAIRCVEDRIATEPARYKELAEWKTIIPSLLNP